MDQKASPQQVDEFLRLFGDDAARAVKAIRSRAKTPTHRQLKASERKISKSPGEVVISVRELSKEYSIGHQKIRALNGVTFDVHQGEFVAITAPSGSGKSTLLQLMGGLDRPTTGTVRVGGIDINGMSDGQLSEFRGKTIGFIFQFFYLQPFLNLERNLEVPGMFAGIKRKDRQERARKLAETVGITDRLAHYPKELSGGQIQRAAIVRALLNNPKVILADEPTGNLDSKNGAGIIDLFEQIRKEFGTTIVVATHDLEVAQRADRIISLQDGVIA